jgi:hypothetical protein
MREELGKPGVVGSEGFGRRIGLMDRTRHAMSETEWILVANEER